MPRVTIPQQPHEFANPLCPVHIEFGQAFQFAIIIPGRYNERPTRHRTKSQTLSKARTLAANGVPCRVIERNGNLFRPETILLVEVSDLWLEIHP